MAGTWQPVMGRVEAGETAAHAAWREVREEVGFAPGALLERLQLEEVHPFFVAAWDAVMLTPRFAARVPEGWEPTLSAEHTAWRWVSDEASFLWPGQQAAVRELRELLSPANAARRAALRLEPG